MSKNDYRDIFVASAHHAVDETALLRESTEFVSKLTKEHMRAIAKTNPELAKAAQRIVEIFEAAKAKGGPDVTPTLPPQVRAKLGQVIKLAR